MRSLEVEEEEETEAIFLLGTAKHPAEIVPTTSPGQ